MGKEKGKVYERIERDVKNKLIREIKKAKNKREKEFKSLPDNYPLKHFKIRENELSTFYERVMILLKGSHN